MSEKALRVLCGFAATAVFLAAAAAPAGAKSIGQLSSYSGVTVPGSPYRYFALSNDRHTPGGGLTRGRWTIVVRTLRSGGALNRWWQLPGGYMVPAVAYDLRSAGGLSADGSTLVLSRLSTRYPPRVSRFAVLDTGQRLNAPWDPPRHRGGGAVRRIALRGDYSFQAISPDGTRIYLSRRRGSFGDGPHYIANHRLQVVDLRGTSLPQPIPDGGDPARRTEGVPITSVTSRDGRWAYTLYDGMGRRPFIQVLDTVHGRADAMDLPQLRDRSNRFMLGLRLEDGGRGLAVFERPSSSGRTLLRIDTRRLEVSDDAKAAATEGPERRTIVLASLALAVATAIGAPWAMRRRTRAWRG